MPIDVTCQCGKSFRAKNEHAGLKSKCPNCGGIINIPKARLDSVTIPESAVNTGLRAWSQALQEPDRPAVADGVGIEDLEKGLEEDRLGSEREATLTDVWKVLNTIATSLGSPLPKSASGVSQQREYKVITQKDKWFSGKFDPEKVEGVLNSYAKQGWTLKGVATASIPGFAGGQREEIVIIMER
jgi:hypothetical protein